MTDRYTEAELSTEYALIRKEAIILNIELQQFKPSLFEAVVKTNTKAYQKYLTDKFTKLSIWDAHFDLDFIHREKHHSELALYEHKINIVAQSRRMAIDALNLCQQSLNDAKNAASFKITSAVALFSILVTCIINLWKTVSPGQPH